MSTVRTLFRGTVAPLLLGVCPPTDMPTVNAMPDA